MKWLWKISWFCYGSLNLPALIWGFLALSCISRFNRRCSIFDMKFLVLICDFQLWYANSSFEVQISSFDVALFKALYIWNFARFPCVGHVPFTLRYGGWIERDFSMNIGLKIRGLTWRNWGTCCWNFSSCWSSEQEWELRCKFRVSWIYFAQVICDHLDIHI